MLSAGKMAYCGIDIGKENMALSFIMPNEEVITYKGAVNGKKSYLIRYAQDEEPIELRLVRVIDTYRDICCLLSMVDELKHTTQTYIELQVCMHNSSILKLEGVILGFLLGRYTRMQIASCSSIKRTNFANAYVKKHNITGRHIVGNPPATKVNTMYMVGHLFPDFYDYLLQFVNRSSEWDLGKMDDACDTIAYAYMARVS